LYCCSFFGCTNGRTNLFGYYQRYTRSVTDQTDVSLLTIDKEEMLRLLEDYPAGTKTFFILMERLAQELNDSRLNVSRVLNQLQYEGLVELHRGRVVIPQLERLMQAL